MTDTLNATLSGRNIVLPPNGYAAFGKGLFEFSGIVNGRKIDYIESPEYFYADGRGHTLNTTNIALTNSAVVLREKGSVWIIPIDETEKISFRLSAMNLSEKVTVVGCDNNGNILDMPTRSTLSNGWLTVNCDNNIFKYQIKNQQ